jgi:hypothetical protein
MAAPSLTAERLAIGLLVLVVVATALAYFAETVGWVWRQFW